MNDCKDFKIIFIPQLSGDGEFIEEYDELSEAVAALNAIANYTLFLHDTSLMPDYSNTGMIYKNTGNEWVEIGDDSIEI